MRVVVTGSTGFVGSHLAMALVGRGDDVVCVVRSIEKAKRLLGGAALELVPGDLGDDETLRAVCQGADIVYHSAGLTTARSREEFVAVNAASTERLLQATADAAANVTRFVYISSQAAAGPSKRGIPKTESDPPNPVSDYGASKLAGEDAVRGSHIPWTIVRPCAVYGPGDKAFLSVFKMARLGFFPVVGDKRQELSMIYIDDLTRALLNIVVPATESQTYFVSHPEVLRHSDLCRHIGAAVSPNRRRQPLALGIPPWFAKSLMTVTGTAARLAGKSTFLSPDKGKELLSEAWVCSPGRLEKDTEWSAKVAYEDGAEATAKWYRENGWL